MIKDHIDRFISRQSRNGRLEERDRNLILLLRQFEALSPDQQLQVFPQLEITLSRHEELTESLNVIRRFFFAMEQNAKRSSEQTSVKTLPVIQGPVSPSIH
jgi:hypothetical protein